MNNEFEVAELQQALGAEEERTRQCQREIQRLRSVIRSENNELDKEYERIYRAGFHDGECYYAGREISGALPEGSFYFHHSWSPKKEE
jgi:regulator of replication initiation timing